MPGIRADRFLASTAIVFLLCAAGGGAFADPPTAASVNAALAAPISPAPAAATQSDTAAKPTAAQDASPATSNPAATPKSERLRRRKSCSRSRGGADFNAR